MAHIVKCRICKQQFDTEKLSVKEWIMPNPRCYYHRTCYEDWKANRNNLKASGYEDDFWYESLVDYLYRDIKMPIDFTKLQGQWENFTKPAKKMTPKGIYFAIRYYYDILHGDIDKAQGGIGIVPNIYNDSARYWIDLETRKTGTLEAIIQQIKQRQSRPVQQIQRKDSIKKDKTKWSLEDI